MSRQLCTFIVDGALFGIDVTSVQEVLRHQLMTRVPLAPRVVRGLINLRGQIVTALDLRLRLGLPPRGTDTLPMNVIVRTADGIVSLLVDDVGDVVDVHDSEFEKTPETMPAGSRGLIEGVYKTKPQLLLVLDTKRATSLGENNAKGPGQ
jgi:purine-binding chemotaxis protein CheW